MCKAFQNWINTLRPMTWRQRFEHIWEYYKPQMIIAAILLMLVAACVAMYQNARVQILYSGLMANIQPSEEGWEYLENGYRKHMGGEEGDSTVHISLVYFEDIYSMEGLDKSYNAAISGVAMVSGGSVDYILCDLEALEFYMTQDMLMDLSLLFTEEEIQQLERDNKLIYLNMEETGITAPVAVCIDDMAFVHECLSASGPVYFALAANTDQLSQCRDFWQYLQDWK